MQKSPHGLVEAFTLTELLLVILFLVALACLACSCRSRGVAENRAKLIDCNNRLKNIDLAFKTWALDGDRYPMDTPVRNGGTEELIGSDRLVKTFLAMSNELSTPELLVCPADNRRPAARFDAGLSTANISYFVGLDCSEETPDMLLAGDRNLTNGLPIEEGILSLPTNCPVGWTHRLHDGWGNVGLADGSVHQMTSSRLWQQLCAGGMATNRLMMP